MQHGLTTRLLLIACVLCAAEHGHAKAPFPGRAPIAIEPADPGRLREKASDLNARVLPVAKGKRGAKRKPRPFKKITAKRLIKLADDSLKDGGAF